MMIVRRPNLLWESLGAAGLFAVLIALLYAQLRRVPSEELAAKARRQELAGQIRVALASAAEAEKSAVLAITDGDSQRFADEARAATAQAEEKRAELAALLARGTGREKELLARFSDSFAEYQRVDKEVLDLAVRNTNLKASALAFGPAAEAIGEMDAALSRLIARAADARVVRLAAGAQAAALRIQALLPPHIAEESDARMDALEAGMDREDRTVREDLAALRAAPEAGQAAASYVRFARLKAEILRLSRENTNVRSLALSLNQKRAITLACQNALADLEAAIAQEAQGVATRPVRAR
jgi:hypothetical protein